jgi:hypothetical protein
LRLSAAEGGVPTAPAVDILINQVLLAERKDQCFKSPTLPEKKSDRTKANTQSLS